MIDKQTEEAVLNVSLAQTEEMFRERVLEVLVQELINVTVQDSYGATANSTLKTALINFLTYRVNMHVTVPTSNSQTLAVQIYPR